MKRHACLLALLVSLCSCSERVRLDLFAPEPEDDDADVPSQPAMDAAVEASAPGLDAQLASSSLIVRYDFAGQGIELRDLVGGARARIVGGASLDDAGGVWLDGVDDYVDLPNRLLAPLESATLMTWLSWSGGVCWQRVFDFGRSDAGEGAQASALASLFVTFTTCPEGVLSAWYEQPPRAYYNFAPSAAPSNRLMQVTMVFDQASGLMTLYLDGVMQAQTAVPFTLAELQEDNAWLGRSQWRQDAFTRGRYEEFRLYGRALTASEVASAFMRGPDAP